ncbi:MAG: hypothetical protein R3F45_03915 [Gammaproteobacteria bacterium]
MSDWLSTAEFAALAGISRQMAHRVLSRCLTGALYKGHRLAVAQRPGSRGRGGISYLVDRKSIPFAKPMPAGGCPQELAAYPGSGEAVAMVAQGEPSTELAIPHVLPADDHDLKFKLDAVLDVIRSTRRRTPERRKRIAEIAATWAAPDGTQPSISALNRWIQRYEHYGVNGLRRKGREDRGQKRTLFSREYDAEARSLVSEEVLVEFKKRVRAKINSMHAGRSCTLPVLQTLFVADLKAFLIENGSQLPDREMIRICTLPTVRFFEPDVGIDLLSIKSTDASAYVAKVRPDIRRIREHNGSPLRPMQVVAMDVNHMDVLYRREDGSTATPKFVAGICLATNRLVCCKVFALEAGQAIRRTHVMEALAEMCATYGVPETIYIDNGAEFRAMGLAADLCRLAQMMNRRDVLVVKDIDDLERVVIRGTPYIAQGKIIESIFAALRSLFALSPNFIGGNRLTKKTANLGRDPEPFDGTIAELKAMVQRRIDFYHTKPQATRSHLKGLSPNEAYKRWLDDGFQPVTADQRHIEIAFAIEETRVIRKSGRFSWTSKRFPKEGARFYRSDALQLYTGRSVRIREPLVGPRHALYVFDLDGQPIATAIPEIAYDVIDHEGAQEQARREGVLTDVLEAIKGTLHTIDYEQSIDAAIAAHGPPPRPSAAATITCGGEYASAAAHADAMLAIGDERLQELEDEERRRKQFEALDKFEKLKKKGRAA